MNALILVKNVGKLYIMVEFCALGSMEAYLRQVYQFSVGQF